MLDGARSGPLPGLRVLIAGVNRASALTGLLLLELGADVVYMGEPGATGAIERYAHEVYGQRVRFATPGADPGRIDGVVHHHEFCGSYCVESLAGEPALGWCELTSFGPLEPGGRPGRGRAVEAAAGLMYASYAYEGDRPVYPPAPLASHGSALLAAFAVQLAMFSARRTGATARMSVSEVAGALLVQAIGAVYRDAGENLAEQRRRDPLQAAGPTIRCYQSSDGWVLIAAPSAAVWARAAVAMDRLDLMVDERFYDAPWGLTTDAATDLMGQIQETLRTATTAEWVERFREQSVPVAPVLTVGEFRALEHLRESGAVGGPVDRPEIALWKHLAARPGDGEPGEDVAGGNGAAAAGGGPLAGVKVVELATFAAGPYAAASLADFGAEVVKVEAPPAGDPYREQGLAFAHANRHKRSVQLDVSKPDGRREFAELVGSADVLILNMRVSGLRKLGLDFDSVREMNPRIVYCWIAGWGSGGPWEDEAGVDPMFQAVSGLAQINGGSSGWLRLVPTGGLDMFAGLSAAAGVTAALLSGDGGAHYIESSLARSAMLSVIEPFLGLVSDHHSLGRDPVGPRALDRIYRTGDDWLYLHVHTETGWTALAGALGLPDVHDRHPEALKQTYDSPLAAEIGAALATRPRADWLNRLNDLPPGALVVQVNRASELVEQSRSGRTDLFLSRDDDRWGPLWQLAPLVRTHRTDTTDGGSHGR